MDKPKRVLQILASTMRAGVEMTVMNLYREIDRDHLQFDFIVHDLGQDDFGDEIAQMGGRVFRVPLLSQAGVPQFVQMVYKIIRQNGPYIAIHAHTDYQGGFSAMAAKKAGVPIRICHAHTNFTTLHAPLLTAKRRLGRLVIGRYATQRCACSQNAAIAQYGRHAVRKGLVQIVHNSIDLSGFITCPAQTRKELQKRCLADEQTRLIGYVGRFNPEKNPSFILDMANEAKQRGLNDRFVFVGTGVMLEELKNKRQALGLEETAFFLGTRNDVPALMQCFDLLVIPSFAEGFSLVAAEAQAAGTPVLAASCVPREADMGLGLLHWMDLKAGAAAFVDQAEAIMHSAIRPDPGTRISALKTRGFDSKTNFGITMNLYGLDQPTS